MPAGKSSRAARRKGSPRLGIEQLEDRVVPAGTPTDVVVGRTLSAYTVDHVQNNSLNVTYTRYNETADDPTGVLLTTTLQPGVSFASASALPDRGGQEVGSLRGARGTLGSQAGNALDEASLGVALFRASGIPARYAQGTLADPLARQLILSMFPDPLIVIGDQRPAAQCQSASG